MIVDKYDNVQIEFTNNTAIVNIDDDYSIKIDNTKNALHLDIVNIKIYENDGRTHAEVTEVVNRHRIKFVGKVKKNKKTTFVVVDNQKIHVDFYIKGGLVADSDSKVIIELTKWENTKSPQAKIIEILGNANDNDVEMNSIMIEYNLSAKFSDEVIEESNKISTLISEDEIKKRRDFRNINTFTIDPIDAKDFDDALSIEKIDNYYRIGIHIADVSFYLKENTLIDDEALSRSTSIYLVDRVVPMLPEILSNNICSLIPDKDRLTYSVVIDIDDNGDILNEWYGRTIIHSNKRFTYEEAQDIIEYNHETNLSSEVKLLNNLAKKLRSKRISNGSIEMDGAEVKFKLDDAKKPVSVYFKKQKDSNKLIEEFMLLANKSVAKFIKSKLGFCVNRVHPKPDLDKLNELKKISNEFGYKLDISNQVSLKYNINNLINDIKGKPEENFITNLIIRSQNKAYYTTEDIPHYGLSFDDYCHFTSCIRRYSDVITHRLLSESLKNNGYNEYR